MGHDCVILVLAVNETYLSILVRNNALAQGCGR